MTNRSFLPSPFMFLLVLAAPFVGACAVGSDDIGTTKTTAPTPAEDTDVPPEDVTPPEEDTDPPPEADPPPSTEYPSGPYGKSVGATFPNLSWSGYKDSAGAWTTITMNDYFDPDGSKGVRAVLIEMSAVWCGVCQSEAARFSPTYSSWKSKGARFATLMVQNLSRGPATQADVDLWVSKFKTSWDVVADPAMSLAPPTGGSIGLPYNIILDPRTMKIVQIIQGDGSAVDSTMNSLIKKNGG